MDKIYKKYKKNKNINNLIEKYYCEKDCNIKIINCYEVKQSEDLDKIIKENGYTQILNSPIHINKIAYAISWSNFMIGSSNTTNNFNTTSTMDIHA